MTDQPTTAKPADKPPLLTGAQLIMVLLILVNAYLISNGHQQLDARFNTMTAQVAQDCTHYPQTAERP